MCDCYEEEFEVLSEKIEEPKVVPLLTDPQRQKSAK
jgi:hypothetical protein